MSELKTLQNAIKTAISAEFSGVVNTVELYGEAFKGSVPTPAVIISLDDAEQGALKSDGRLALDCTFSAACILAFVTTNVQVEIREFALQMMQLVNRNVWGMPDDVEPAGNISMQPGPFNPDKSGYESMIISWQQTVYVGPSVWGGTTTDVAVELHFGLPDEETVVLS